MSMKFKIQDREVGEGSPCLVIAEAGVNHNGDLELAHRLVDAAAAAGADVVKFQTFETDLLVARDTPKAKYQNEALNRDLSQYEMLKRLELPHKDFIALKAYAESKKLIFLSTPFDSMSLAFLRGIDVAAYKIGSGDLTNHPHLRDIAVTGKPVILSTGMANLKEVREAVGVIYQAGGRDLVVLHCTTQYPTQVEMVNLRAMQTLHAELKLPVGFSDHTTGVSASCAAVAMGACVIEKHFTLDRTLSGPDHAASLEPAELKHLVEEIRHVEKLLGSPEKQPSSEELEVAMLVRKSLIADQTITAGTVVGESLLAARRPGGGISPADIRRVIDKRALRDIASGSELKWEDLQ